MPTFPLPFRPKTDYHAPDKHLCYYGARRDGGARKHAACDLIAPEGTEIYAVEDGTVGRYSKGFYHHTDVVEFKLTSGRTVRYCEIKGLAPGVHTGLPLKEGELIAFVGKMLHSSMLHFEMYEGTAHGDLTDRSNKPFQRRKDLIDPTEYLDNCTVKNVLAAPQDAPAAATHAATHHKAHGSHMAHGHKKAHAHHKAGGLSIRWIR